MKHAFYNQALFDNMSFFADSVWELDPENESIYIMHEKLMPSLKERSFSFNEMNDFLKNKVKPEIQEKALKIINKDFLKNLTDSYYFTGSLMLDGRYHELQCEITPSFNVYNKVERAYLSLKDVQERIAEKAETEKSKNELNRYLSAVSCGIIQYTRDSKQITYINDTALQILDYSSMEEIQKDHFNGIAQNVIPEDAEKMLKMINGLKKDGDNFECEYRVLHKDGSLVTCFGNVRLLEQEGSEPLIQRSMIDITERRRTGRLYTELTEVLEVANIGLWYLILDEGDPRFYSDSQTAAQIGCDENIAPEKAFTFWYYRIQSEYKKVIDIFLDKMRQGRSSEVVFPYNHPTRGQIIVRFGGHKNDTYSGSGIMIRGYQQDVTEYTQRLNEQKEKEENQRSILQSIASIYSTMHVLDLENEVIEEKSAISPVHNYIEAHSQEDLQEIMWGTMRSRFIGVSREAIMNFTNFSTLESRMGNENTISIELKNIENKWFRLSFIRIGDTDKPLKKVVFVSQDIDKEKCREESLILMSNTDELTQIFNRHAFENDIKELGKNKLDDDLWFMAVDLNGLKKANDTIGHEAGDELLIATSECLRKAIGGSGKVYRVSGDEFICIFHASDKEILETLKYLEIIRSNWHGKLNDTVSFSKGLVNVKEIEDCTIAKLEKESDLRMYAEKRDFYLSQADRRNR